MGAAGTVAATNPTVPLQWPLVGRHEEIELFAATLADPRAHGFVIHGAAGVGKTRLADQCMALAVASGRSVARATATDGSRSIPLGALAHLLPAGIGNERGDLVTVMSEVRPVLTAQATNGPLVLFVDDLQLLDTTSATFVGQLVDADLVFLVATVRADEPLPPGLDALWHRARVRRIDLDDLDRAALDTLLHLVLHGPVEASTVSELWTASRGNVLFVRELVIGAIEGGRLVHQHGVWRLVGALVTTPRLQELVATRLHALEPAAADAVERLAVWEPTGLSMLEDVVGEGCLELLDRAGLLTVRTEDRRQTVTLAHPLYGEILRARMPALTRRRLLLEHAERIDALGARRREDPIRSAIARLEASGSADAQLLVRAARLARYGYDFANVERLGRAALRDGMTPEIGLLLGEALHELRAFEEADHVLTAATEAAHAKDPLLVHITEIHARNVMWGLARPEDAIEINRLARDRVSDPRGREELTLSEAVLLTYSGRPLDALDVLESMGPLSDPRARALRAVAEIPALIAAGRPATAAEAASVAFVEHSALPDQIAIPRPGVHMLTRVYALAECGRLDDAVALGTAAYEAIPATAPPDALMWLSFQLGRCALLGGKAETARRWLGEALARCDAEASIGPSRLVLSALATAHAVLGDAAAAAATVGELDRRPPFPFTRPEQELGRAWALAAAGDLAGARRTLLAAADLAAATGYRATEAWILHDVARLGDAASVADRLDALRSICEGDLIDAYADHAAAAVAGRAEALVDTADRFERIGARLLAAEAATEAARAYQRQGNRRAATALMVRATALGQACEGARTPALTALDMVVPLTSRERDIATLAAQGVASKAIADRLFLSVRTVNNHLQSVYSKLGVTGRRQLASAMDPTGPGATAPLEVRPPTSSPQ
jgi:DNA-binding CsgD family transcriptional regulator